MPVSRLQNSTQPFQGSFKHRQFTRPKKHTWLNTKRIGSRESRRNSHAVPVKQPCREQIACRFSALKTSSKEILLVFFKAKGNPPHQPFALRWRDPLWISLVKRGQHQLNPLTDVLAFFRHALGFEQRQRCLGKPTAKPTIAKCVG